VFEKTIRTILMVEARESTERVLNNIVHSLEEVDNHLGLVGKASQDASQKYERSINTIDAMHVQQQAALARTKAAERELKDATDALKRASEHQAKEAVGGAQRQIDALGRVEHAQREYRSSLEKSDRAIQELRAAQEQEQGASGKSVRGHGLLKGAMVGVGAASLGATAAIADFAKGSIESGAQFQSTTAKIANSANISTTAAQNIGNAFLTTAGQTTFGADEIASAYSKVAGQLGLTEGHALSSKDALQFMSQATDTAEASGQSLSSTTGTLAKIMQAYHLKTKDVGSASDIMYNASRLTGQNFSQLGNVMTRMKGQLGVLAPGIKQTSTLMVDMAAHGLTGRQQMGALNSAFGGLTKISAKTVPTVGEVHQALKALPQPLQALAREYAHGQISAKDYTTKLGQLPQAMQTYGKSFKSISDKAGQDANTLNALNFTPAQQQMSKLGVHVYDSTGKFVGFRQILSQMSPKINELHGNQAKLAALQPIFGSNSKKMLGVIEGGTKAWDKYSKAISDHKAREEAAKRAGDTYEGSMKKLHATVKDLKISLGNALMPAVMSVLHAFQKVITPVIQWIQHNKKLASSIALGIGSLTAMIGSLYAAHKVFSKTKDILKVLKDDFGNVIGKVKEFGGKAVELGKKVISGVGKAADVMKSVGSKAIDMGKSVVSGVGKGIQVIKDFNAMSKIQLAIEKAKLVATKVATAAQWLFNAAMDANPIVLIVIAVVALVAIFILLYKHSKLVRDIVADIGKAFKAAFNFILKIVKDVWNWIKKNWPLIIEIIAGPVGWIIAIWTHFHKQIIDIFKKVIDFIKDVWDKVANFASKAFDKIINFFKDLPGKAMDALGDFVSTVWNKIVIGADWLDKNIWHPIWSFFSGLPGKIASAASGMWDGVSGAFKDAVNWIIDHWDSFGFSTPKISLGPFGDIPSLHFSMPHIPEWRAAGGPVFSGNSYIVGERGPELLSFGSSGSILSNYNTGKAIRGGGSGGDTHIHVNVTMQGHVYGSLDDLAKKLGGHLTKSVLPNGGVLLR